MDLQRFANGSSVLARPTLYRTTLKRRVQSHLDEIREWLRTNLIYQHEEQRLKASYARLEAQEDDWIVGARALSFSQITLYLGAFLTAFGGILYFRAHFAADITTLWGAIAFLAVPFVGLNLVGQLVYRRGRKPVAVGFFLAATLLLPLFLLITFDTFGLWPQQAENDLFAAGYVSNRQLQIASFIACIWAAALVVSTRTATLSTCFSVLLFTFHISLLAEFGLTDWLDNGEWHVVALYLTPLVALFVVLGGLGEHYRRETAARPQYFAAVGLWALTLELIAQNGKAFELVGLSMNAIQGAEVSDPQLLNSLTAMTINGLILYATASALERRGSLLLRGPAGMLSPSRHSRSCNLSLT